MTHMKGKINSGGMSGRNMQPPQPAAKVNNQARVAQRKMTAQVNTQARVAQRKMQPPAVSGRQPQARPAGGGSFDRSGKGGRY